MKKSVWQKSILGLILALVLRGSLAQAAPKWRLQAPARPSPEAALTLPAVTQETGFVFSPFKLDLGTINSVLSNPSNDFGRLEEAMNLWGIQHTRTIREAQLGWIWVWGTQQGEKIGDNLATLKMHYGGLVLGRSLPLGKGATLNLGATLGGGKLTLHLQHTADPTGLEEAAAGPTESNIATTFALIAPRAQVKVDLTKNLALTGSALYFYPFGGVDNLEMKEKLAGPQYQVGVVYQFHPWGRLRERIAARVKQGR